MSRYKIRREVETGVPSITGEADELDHAVQSAWILQRYTEAPVVIEEIDGGEKRVIARLNLEWLDD